MSTSVARATTYAAHPYAAATSPHMASHARAPSTARVVRRASYQAPPPPLPLSQTSIINMPLPPTPTSSAPPPAYSRHDKPGADTRFAKVDRTANWVAQQQYADEPVVIDNPSLQSYGYFAAMASEPPTYSNSPASPSRMDSTGRVRDPDYRRPVGTPAELPSGVIGRALARSMGDEPKTVTAPRASKSASTSKAKSVLRKLVGGKSDDASTSHSYVQLNDEASSMLH